MGLKLKEELWNVVDGSDAPAWYVKGVTVMIPKAVCEGKPEQFR